MSLVGLVPVWDTGLGLVGFMPVNYYKFMPKRLYADVVIEYVKRAKTIRYVIVGYLFENRMNWFLDMWWKRIHEVDVVRVLIWEIYIWPYSCIWMQCSTFSDEYMSINIYVYSII